MITFKEAITTCKRVSYLYLARLSHSDDIFDKLLIVIGRTQIRKRIPRIIIGSTRSILSNGRLTECDSL